MVTKAPPPLRREILLALCVLGILSYSWMYRGVSVPNERSRVYLTLSIAEQHTLSIDGPVQHFGKLTDWAAKDHHYYTDKAPGASLLGLIPYKTAQVFGAVEHWSISKHIQLMRTWLMLPIGLLGFLLMRRMLRFLTIKEHVVDLISLSWILGTSAFHYSTAFYGHQIVAVTLLASLYLTWTTLDALQNPEGKHTKEDAESAEETEPRRLTRRLGHHRLRLFIAGACAGMAGLTEYQSVIPCILLLGFLVSHKEGRSPSALLPFILGAAPFAILLLGYNTLAFGGPLELSYHYLVDQRLHDLHNQGIGGVSTPRLKYMGGAFFTLHRGLFATSPLFFALPFGIRLLWKRDRRPALLLGAALLYYGLFISSTSIWSAGWGFGPRLLVPMMSWAMIPVAFAVQAASQHPILSNLLRGLALWGIAYHQLVHAIMPELPKNATNPIMDLILPAILQGQHVPNLPGLWLGWRGLSSLIPLLLLLLIAARIVWLKDNSAKGTHRGHLRFWVPWAVFIPFVAAIFFVGPRFEEKKRTNFIEWMEKMQQKELPPK